MMEKLSNKSYFVSRDKERLNEAKIIKKNKTLEKGRINIKFIKTIQTNDHWTDFVRLMDLVENTEKLEVLEKRVDDRFKYLSNLFNKP